MTRHTGASIPLAISTTAGRAALADPGLDDRRRATHPRRDPNCGRRAIAGTGAALHATVRIDDFGRFIFNLHNTMRADPGAHPASNAFVRFQCQGRHSGNISEIFHGKTPCAGRVGIVVRPRCRSRQSRHPKAAPGGRTQAKAAATHSTAVVTSATACTGMARRISFSTPDGEV